MLIDIVIRVSHTLDLLSVFVWNLDPKLLFETHHEFDRVLRVGAEVVDKSCVGRHLVFIDTKLIDDYLFYLVLDLLIGHRVLLLCELIKLNHFYSKRRSGRFQTCRILYVQRLHVATGLACKT